MKKSPQVNFGIRPRGKFISSPTFLLGPRSPSLRSPETRFVASLLLLLVAFSFSPTGWSQSDKAGSQDHPLLSRFQGSYIRRYKVDDFGEFKAALGPGYQSGGASVALRKSQSYEGKHTMIQYVAPAGKSDLEIIRSYEQALMALKFTKLYSCGNAECGVNLNGQLYTNEENLNPMLGTWNSTMRYSLWKGTKDGVGYTVAVCAVAPPPGPATTVYQVDIVEKTQMQQNTVTVDAGQMKQSIQQDGHVALYGIYFDTGSSQVGSASADALVQIAKLLKDNPSLHIAIVGHTDTQGSWESNMNLSRLRAAAVVHELTTKYEISNARIISAGVGAAAPVADNRTDAGRSKNRRVELVELP